MSWPVVLVVAGLMLATLLQLVGSSVVVAAVMVAAMWAMASDANGDGLGYVLAGGVVAVCGWILL